MTNENNSSEKYNLAGLLMYKIMNENQICSKAISGNTELQAPDFGQTHTAYGGVKNVSGCLTLP